VITYRFFLEWEIFQTNVVEKIKTRILCSKTFFLVENRAIYEITWKKYNTAEQATEDDITRRMHFACWIITATDTYSQFTILTLFPLQQWLYERDTTLRYTYIGCLVHFSEHHVFEGFSLGVILWRNKLSYYFICTSISSMQKFIEHVELCYRF
jgi:hypothetical protein